MVSIKTAWWYLNKSDWQPSRCTVVIYEVHDCVQMSIKWSLAFISLNKVCQTANSLSDLNDWSANFLRIIQCVKLVLPYDS